MKRRHSSESGFAMLLVFVMAASVAIMLYLELPRVAFEAQRQREELLIERGEQYMRGIQLYVRKFKRYPATLEEMETTNNIRFLRRRYTDPMTGKDEWRLVHVGPGGVYTDSLIHKPAGTKKEEKAANTFTWEAPTVGATAQAGQGGQGAFPPLRPSEQRGMVGFVAQGQPVSDPQQQPQQPGFSPQPGQVPGQVYVQPGQVAPQPGQYYAQPGQFPGQPGQVPGQPGQVPSQPGAFPQFPQPYPPPPPGQQQPGQFPGAVQGVTYSYPYQQQQQQTGVQSPYSTAPGAQGPSPLYQQQGRTPAGSNQALNLIQQLLTSPRQAPAGLGAPGLGGQQIGGGIAGVASTVERQGIKLYNERDKYNEWEFLYDLSKDTATTAGMQPGQGAQGAAGQQGGVGIGGGVFGQTGFGQAGGTGQQPSTGSSPFVGGGSPFIGGAPASGQAPTKPTRPGAPLGGRTR